MPRIEPDFDKVHAMTPVWGKGLYELVLGKPRGSAYDKSDDKTGKSTHVAFVGVRPKIVGIFDSNGVLSTDVDGTDIEGQQVEEIRLYLHSQGAREFSKRIMMAIFGYEGDAKGEAEYNEWVKTLDLSFESEENEDGEGYTVTLGDGWQLLEGKHVKSMMDKGSFKDRNDEVKERQDFNSFFPVNSTRGPGAKKKGK
jgi:hypothetical protein